MGVNDMPLPRACRPLPLETPRQPFDRTGLAPSPSTHRGLHPLPYTIPPPPSLTSPMPPPSVPKVNPAPALYSHDPALHLSKRPLPSTNQTLPLNQPSTLPHRAGMLVPAPTANDLSSLASFRRPVSRAITVWFISLASSD